MKRQGRKSAAQTPAPKKERISGSKINKPNLASTSAKSKSIIKSESVISTLRNYAADFNKEYSRNKVSLDTLKAVFHRGTGAYSSSHRPRIKGGKPNNRNAWGFARVKAFLRKKSGKEVKKSYIQDDDLLKE